MVGISIPTVLWSVANLSLGSPSCLGSDPNTNVMVGATDPNTGLQGEIHPINPCHMAVQPKTLWGPPWCPPNIRSFHHFWEIQNSSKPHHRKQQEWKHQPLKISWGPRSSLNTIHSWSKTSMGPNEVLMVDVQFPAILVAWPTEFWMLHRHVVGPTEF